MRAPSSTGSATATPAATSPRNPSKGRIAKLTIVTGPGSGSTLELPRPDDAVLKVKDEPARSR